ncbi:MAG: hypothetical protein J6M66_05390 [Lachnospiraceae bacterium]|nr:hypothetical protein [Lachnospiraceae bacterium]
MAAIVYLAAAFLPGRLLTELIMVRNTKDEGHRNRIWVLTVSCFGIGVLALSWLLYFLAYLLHVALKVKQPLLPANIIVILLVAVCTAIYVIRRRKDGRRLFGENLISDRKLFLKECIWFGLLFAFFLYTMAYVFHVTGDRLYSGFTVFSDYAPHTAMIRSFSHSANYPTQYPHFGGADVKYHFMFQFLVGNLEYLGLRIDMAYNLVSALSLWGFVVMLCQLAYRLSGSFAAVILAPVLLVFRSGTAFFRFVEEHLKAGDLLKTLADNTTFIGYTPNENWGLWNYNVYLNQRHLGFGLLIMSVVIWAFLDMFEESAGVDARGFAFIKNRIISKEAWKPIRPERALLFGMIIGLCSFWNGACVIGGLLILCGMAVFSNGKADYLILAAVAVFFSWIETHIFITGQAFSFGWYWGFLSENKTLPGVLWYLIQVTGLTFVGLIPALLLMKRKERLYTAAFLFPLIFAFCFSLTPDINVNHKYIMISMAFMSVIWSVILAKLFRYGAVTCISAGLVIALLTVTGLYDFVVIVKDNDAYHRLSVPLHSEITDWISDNLSEKELMLTPEYSMNEVTMSGVMMYMGWPYYAWSAGYDTYYRGGQASLIYTTDDPQILAETVKRENIKYILYEEEMTYEELDCREDVIASVYPEVFRSEDGRIRIYETRTTESVESDNAVASEG